MDKELQQYQSRKTKAEQKTMIGGFLILPGIALVLTLGDHTIFLWLGILFIIIGAISIAMGASAYSKVVMDFKLNFLKKMMGEWIEEGEYYPKRGLTKTEVYHSEFLKRADRFYAEDLITGKIDGVTFKSSDLKLEERKTRHTKNGTQTYYETFFRGQMYVFDFNKTFDGFLQVLERGRPISRRKYEKIKLESMAFNKKFTTYSTNSHSAFYVLTPHFMESMMKIEREHPGQIFFSFIDTQMHMAINNNKDNFAIRMFRKIDQALIETFKKDLAIIYDIVDDLKLNKNIFKEDQS